MEKRKPSEGGEELTERRRHDLLGGVKGKRHCFFRTEQREKTGPLNQKKQDFTPSPEGVLLSGGKGAFLEEEHPGREDQNALFR